MKLVKFSHVMFYVCSNVAPGVDLCYADGMQTNTQPLHSIYDIANRRAAAAYERKLTQARARLVYGQDFSYPSAGESTTARAAFLQGYTGYQIPDAGERWLTSEDIRRWIDDCKWLRKNPAGTRHAIPDTHKLCSDCHKILPATSKYFHRNKNGRDGLHSICRSCKSVYRKGYYQARGR